MSFELGDTINHSKFGKGEVIYIEGVKNSLGKEITYVDVHFENDSKYMVRTFTEESLKPFLTEVK